MFAHDRDDWRFGFWSALALELLARSALANVSQALLADPRDWNNLYFALGSSPKVSRFVPKSIDVSTVFFRLHEVLPHFETTLESFGIGHMAKRNEELHSGKTPFDSAGSSSWLPTYYQTCEVLLESLGEDLEVLFGATVSMIIEIRAGVIT